MKMEKDLASLRDLYNRFMELVDEYGEDLVQDIAKLGISMYLALKDKYKLAYLILTNDVIIRFKSDSEKDINKALFLTFIRAVVNEETHDIIFKTLDTLTNVLVNLDKEYEDELKKVYKKYGEDKLIELIEQL